MNLNFLLGKPTIEYCEKAGTSIIKRPFYAFSNLAYLFSGPLILLKGKGSNLSKIFGYLAILIGTLSFIYDVIYTYTSQILDLTGMFLFINVLLFLNLKKIININNFKIIILQVFLTFFALISIILLKGYSGNIIFGLFVLVVVLIEIYLLIKGLHKNIKLWFTGFGLFLIGFCFWLTDAIKIYCDPYKIFNGRIIFHVLTAITIYILYLFYNSQGDSYENNR